MSRPSITALMDGLITRGLVERRPDTDDGRNVLQRADQAVGDRLVAIGTHVNAGDPSVLIASLARFGQAIRAARAAGAT